MEKKWYAVYTKSRKEKVTAERLKEQNIEVYLPLYKTLRQWSDRKKMVEIPLIHSYIFVRTSLSEYFTILNTEGVVTFVKFESNPAPIPDYQIDNLKILLQTDTSWEISCEEFSLGEQVKVNSGPLKGLLGYVVEYKKKKKVLINIESINQNIIFAINPVFIEKTG